MWSAAFISLSLALLPISSDWPSWRGPTGNGVAGPDAAPPIAFGEQENLQWKIELPGLGASTPLVKDGRVYLTCARPENGFELVDGQVPQPPQEMHALLVLGYELSSGKELWRTEVKRAAPHEKLHSTSSLASASLVLGKERLFAFFGSHGVYALDLAGDVQWSKDLGQMTTAAEFGEGATPVLAGETLVIPWDHEGPSSILALSAERGEEQWQTQREGDSSWGSPVVHDGAVLMTGSDATRAYSLADGKPLWQCSGMSKNPCNSPTVTDGVLYVMNSFRGNIVQAIRLEDASGDVQGTESLLWASSKNASYVPNPVVTAGYLYFLRNSRGILSCLDALTGEEQYSGQRIDGVGTVHASPVMAAGRLYIASREGTVAVVKAGPEYELLQVNELEDVFDAVPVIVGKSLLLRGRRHLYHLSEG